MMRSMLWLGLFAGLAGAAQPAAARAVAASAATPAVAEIHPYDPDALRRQAAHFRQLAEQVNDARLARTIVDLAVEYESTAARIEDAALPAPR